MLKKLLVNYALEHMDMDQISLGLLSYGYDVLIHNLIVPGSVLLSGWLIRNFADTCIYVAVLCFLRTHTGGWHAKTKIHCLIAYHLLYLCFLVYMRIPVSYHLIMFLMLCVCVWSAWNAPGIHPYLPLNEIEIQKNRKIVIIGFVILMTACMLIHEYAKVISGAVFINCFLMLLLKLQNEGFL